jgi:cytochrome c biogenesis protein ResB
VLGGLLLINLLAAHLIRFKLSWKRTGILLIHAGLILMLLGELVTGLYAVEGQMAITEGQSSNFVVHPRYAELAVIDPSRPDVDDVVVVPDSLLRKGGRISHPDLPFDIQVVRYMINSTVKTDRSSSDNPATAGAGREAVALEQPEVSGVSTKQSVETPSAYVTFLNKADGRALGTYLVSYLLNSQAVDVNGKAFEVSLRPKRSYRPFSLYLEEFRFDRYPGTNTPRNYSSQVRLLDPERHEDRELVIRMNEPLRYRGETFYQLRRRSRRRIRSLLRNPKRRFQVS